MSSSLTDEDEARRAALRKAGQDYFDQVLKQANAGKDPFTPAPPPPSKKPKKTTKNAQIDAELQAVGSVLDKAKFGVIFVIFLLSSSSAMVFSKLCLDILPAPSTVLVVHMIPTTIVALLASWNSVIESEPFTIQGMRSSLPFVVVHAGMALMVMMALVHMRVETVMGVTAAAAPVITSVVSKSLSNPSSPYDSLPTPQLAAIVVGFVSAVLCTAAEGPNTMSAALWLLPWFVLLVLERACEAVQASALQEPEGEEALSLRWKVFAQVRKVLQVAAGKGPGDEEADATPPPPVGALNKMIYCNALPILPIAILAALRQEGAVFKDMELHVHSIVMMGWSCITGVGASLSSLLLQPLMDPKHFTYTAVGTQLLTLLLVIRGRDDELNLEGLIAAVICVLAGTAFKEWPIAK